MPDIRHLATHLGDGTLSPLEGLRRNYTRHPAPEEPSPAEIVAALHAEIAAKSPEHARLVADFRRVQEEARQVILGDGHVSILRTSKETRIREFGEALAEGKSREEAAELAGVSMSTAKAYLTILRRGAPEPQS